MTQTIQGSKGVALMECVNPRRNKWKVRWNIAEQDDGQAQWQETDFAHKPTLDEVRAAIFGWFNSETDRKILSGFVWHDMHVWLSQENQFNYKSAYDIAVQTGGKSLPVKFKFGTDTEPQYYEFKTLDELADFYFKALAYIQTTLQEGWNAKDAINLKEYGV